MADNPNKSARKDYSAPPATAALDALGGTGAPHLPLPIKPALRHLLWRFWWACAAPEAGALAAAAAPFPTQYEENIARRIADSYGRSSLAEIRRRHQEAAAVWLEAEKAFQAGLPILCEAGHVIGRAALRHRALYLLAQKQGGGQ